MQLIELSLKHFHPGTIVYMDCKYLITDRNIVSYPLQETLPTDVPRPFVLVYQKNKYSIWTMLTRSPGTHGRIEVKREWKTGNKQWINSSEALQSDWLDVPSYIQDFRTVWFGLKSDFLFAAASNHADSRLPARKKINKIGMNFLLDRMKQYHRYLFEVIEQM